MAEAPADRQHEYSGTRQPPPGLAIDGARLVAYLEARVPGFHGPVRVSQFKGGQSNPTYLVETPSGAYVLRRKPPGKLLPSAHAIEREYAVMDALGRAGFPVPKVHHLCGDPDIAGTPFYLMDRVAGRIVWEPAMPGFDNRERAAVYDAMNATLARLHGYDPAALGLADFGRGEAYVARQIRRWSEQYRASRTAEIAAMERLMEWLPPQVPDQPRVSLVHGDFRLDNLVLHPSRPEIVAVLDWELSTLGDPLADFTYHLMQRAMPRTKSIAGLGSLVGLDLDGLGIPQLAPYIAVYEARTGLAVTPHLDFYLAYNFFRMAAILQGIVGRVREGTAANANAAAMALQVLPLAETAWLFAGRAAAGK